ncbi:MAG TPA: YbaK/EbsC family protein [Thermoanaerobaculia bacterium]|nr:YbaK/EbsC family protein [Thermoanaerobaculia bacterium]
MAEQSSSDKVLESLARLGIPHEVMPCDPDFADTAAFCERYHIAPEDSANTIIVASKKEPVQYAACLALATTRVDVNRSVSTLMGIKRLSFASSEQTAQLTGMMGGGVTIFGLPDGVPIYIDGRVMRRESIIVGGGSRSMKIRLDPAGLNLLPGASVVEGLATEPAPRIS